MRAPRLRPVALVFGTALATTGAAYANADSPTDVPADSAVATWADGEAAAEILAALAEEGIEIAPEDLRRLGLLLPDPEPPAAIAATATSASVAFVTEAAADRDPSATLTAAWSHGSWQGHLRGYRRGDARVWRGQFGVVAPQHRVLIGNLGLAHGLGLAAQTPGERGWLTPGGSLAPHRAGLVGSGVRGDPRVRWGVGAAAGSGGGEMTVLVGRPTDEAPVPPPASLWTRLRWRREAQEIAILAGREAQQRCGSLALALAQGSVTSSLECAAWQENPAAPWQRAATAFLRWLTRRGRLDAVVAQARATRSSPLGRRPACLSGWDGWGWAVTARLRTAPTAGVSLLLARSAHEAERGREPRPRGQQRGGMGAWWRVAPGWRLEGRITRRSVHADQYSATAPWLPPAEVVEEDRQDLLLRVEHEAGPWSLRADYRRSDRRLVVPSTVRRLAAVALRWRSDAGWRWQITAASAWGDPVDIITAQALVPDRILPLHWSRWREGLVIAGGRSTGHWRMHAGWLWRRADAAGPGEMTGESRILVEMAIRW